MSLPRRIRDRKEKDSDMERALGIRKNDPWAERLGVTYTPADIRLLEEEKLPWRKKYRRGLS